MFKTILILTALLCFSYAGFAQGDPQNKMGNENSIKKGMFAVQIGVGENFTLSSFGEFTMALKYHLSKKSAIRLGASADFHDYDGTSNLINYEEPENNFSKPIWDRVINHSAQLQYIYYLKNNSLINIYTGIGPKGAYNSKNYIGYGYDFEYFIHYEKYYAFGGTASLGFEWFPVKYLSVTAEYYAYYLKGTNHIERKYYDSNTHLDAVTSIDTKSNDFYWKNAFLGVTLYFSL